MTTTAHKKLTIPDVVALGKTLIEVARLYPTQYVTERDFYPLVVAYLTGRVPALRPEVHTEGGRIDFHLKGPNPTWLELAIQPRSLSDKNFPDIRFPGNSAQSALYASQNRSELRKLMYEPMGKTRFLLLVDLSKGYNLRTLKKGYEDEARKNKKESPFALFMYRSLAQNLSRFWPS